MQTLALHFVFALAYGGLLSLLSLAAGSPEPGSLLNALIVSAPLAVSPVAILLVSKLGKLTSTGVAISAFLILLCIVSTITLTLVYVAIPAIGPPSLNYILQSYARVLQIGGWPFWFSGLLLVAAPWLWSIFLLKRGTSRLQVAG